MFLRALVGHLSFNWPVSLHFNLRLVLFLCAGPIVGILGQKYGVRSVCIAGGTIASLSAALCFFAPDITWITALWGGLGGEPPFLYTLYYRLEFRRKRDVLLLFNRKAELQVLLGTELYRNSS